MIVINQNKHLDDAIRHYTPISYQNVEKQFTNLNTSRQNDDVPAEKAKYCKSIMRHLPSKAVHDGQI